MSIPSDLYGTFYAVNPFQNYSGPPFPQENHVPAVGNAIDPLGMDDFLEKIPQEFRSHLDALRKTTFPLHDAQMIFQGNAIAISKGLLLTSGILERGDTVFIGGREATVFLKVSNDTIPFQILSINDQNPLTSWASLAESTPDSDHKNLYLHVTCQDAIQNGQDLSSITQVGLYQTFDFLAPDAAPVMCPQTGKVFGIHSFVEGHGHLILQTADIYRRLQELSSDQLDGSRAAYVLLEIKSHEPSQLQKPISVKAPDPERIRQFKPAHRVIEASSKQEQKTSYYKKTYSGQTFCERTRETNTFKYQINNNDRIINVLFTNLDSLTYLAPVWFNFEFSHYHQLAYMIANQYFRNPLWCYQSPDITVKIPAGKFKLLKLVNRN